MKNLLVVVDVQKDLMPGGAIEVPNSDGVVPVINSIIDLFDYVVMTKQWHPSDHLSFIDNGGTLPTHCVNWTRGAEFPNGLKVRGVIAYRGLYPLIEDYGAWDSVVRLLGSVGADVSNVFICGLPTEDSVYVTALDTREYDWNSYVITDACRAMCAQPTDAVAALSDMTDGGVVSIRGKRVEELLIEWKEENK